MRRKQPEYKLTCAVATFMHNAAPIGCSWFHVPNGEKRGPRTGAKLKSMGVRAGVPDFLFFWEGRCIAVELKAGKGKESPSQIAMQEEMTLAGVSVTTCRSLEEVQAILIAHNIPLKAQLT